eukprot:Transcript_29354.p1 GENE.Transcript_29354~~Transcript_29354.p1  ORF type:complete len:480 (+),score=243.02 Transcript_29354:190-1629(+)
MLASVLHFSTAFSAPEVELSKPTDVAKGDHWAVLIAGSSGYGNYRHQADVCHAYQIFKRAGVPHKQIITLAVDDIANSPENPFPGKLFNKPTPKGVPGVDVYEGCKIDYSGKKVTPETFVKVLTGDTTGLDDTNSTDPNKKAKVLKSTSKSKVFVNFVDHGGVGIIGFPETTMHAKDLVAALQKMHDQSMYKELVFYLEACESGSMFETLPKDIKIYATTAADASHSSWGTYCMPDDKVDGTEIKSCLGDLYSVNWMEDADKSTKGESLQDQYTVVKKLTNKSTVLQFGDTSIASEMVFAFEGNGAAYPPGPAPGPAPAPPAPAKCPSMCKMLPGAMHCKMGQCSGCPDCAAAAAPSASHAMSLPSADATLASAFHRFLASGDDAVADELVAGVRNRQAAKRRFEAIATKVAGLSATALPELDGPLDVECHYQAHTSYIRQCGEWDAEAMAYSSTLAKLCKHTSGVADAIVSAIGEACA